MDIKRHLLIFLLFLFHSVSCKKITKPFQLKSLSSKPETLFITKFDIGEGQGSFSIRYRKLNGHEHFNKVSLMVGILKDDKYQEFKSKKTCEEKKQLYKQSKYLITSQGNNYGSTSFQVKNQQGEHIWYVYVFDCESETDKSELTGTLQLSITMLNNDSHFGEDQNLFVGYIVLMSLWLFLVIKYFKPVTDSLKGYCSWPQIFVYIGFLFMGLAFFYRLLNIFITYYSGEQYPFLIFLYSGLKYLVEGVLITALVSISWGWSLTHLKHDNTYTIIGTVVSLFNLIAIILDANADQIEEAHHQYDRLIGFLVLMIRLMIFAIFVVGIFRVKSVSVGKRKQFIVKFGRQGGALLIAWPAAVIFSQLFLPNYMHNEVITLIQQTAYIIVNAHLCILFSSPDSDFKKVCITDFDTFIPQILSKTKI